MKGKLNLFSNCSGFGDNSRKLTLAEAASERLPMKTLFGHARYLAIGCAIAGLSVRAESPPRAVDPGVRPGDVNAGAPVAGVDAKYFANVRSAFNERYSIA